MQVDTKTIKAITFGAESITEEDGFLIPSRFTAEELSLYEAYKDADLNRKARGSSHIRFSFVTDSRFLALTCKMASGSSRTYAYFDLYEGGVMRAHLGTEAFESEEMTFSFSLSPGRKHVELYFPWSVQVKIAGLTVDDNAEITPRSRRGQIIFYGDSITQGYDAKFPSLSYANKIARLLHMDSINKAVGGEVFFPELLGGAVPHTPDIVFAAYGTNDWNNSPYDAFLTNCKVFFAKLTTLYPKSKIYVITPLWRGDAAKEVPMAIAHTEVDGIIEEICRAYTNITVICGRELVPHSTHFLADARLHPNELGFLLYATGLYKKITH